MTDAAAGTDARVQWRSAAGGAAFEVHESRRLALNDTFFVRPEAVHRISVREGEMTVLVAFGRPPMDALIYEHWDQGAGDASRSFPYLFDRGDKGEL